MSSKNKLISIIIPVYNVAHYLEKSIGSVYNQGLLENEFEVIIVDDGSTDDSLIVEQNFTKEKNNVLIVSQKNKGLGGARNTGIENAKGDYILFLDADDWILPNVLPNIIEIASENQLEILEFGAQGIDLDGTIKYDIRKKSNLIMNGIDYYNSVRYMNSACNKIYKKDFLISNNLFFLEKIFIEDFEFNTRVFCKAKRVLGINLLVSQFLQSPNSITRNLNTNKKKKMIEDIIIVLKKTKDLYSNYDSKIDRRVDVFFKERLGFIIATLFIQLLKNKMRFYEVRQIKQELLDKNLFYIDFPIFQKNKDLFRKIVLNNFVLFRVLLMLVKII